MEVAPVSNPERAGDSSAEGGIRHSKLPAAKPGHAGTAAAPVGPPVWLLVRTDGVLYGAWRSRHDAIGAATTAIRNAKREWFEPIRLPVGSVPMEDVRYV